VAYEALVSSTLVAGAVDADELSPHASFSAISGKLCIPQTTGPTPKFWERTFYLVLIA
jgi:hypothetical protein